MPDCRDVILILEDSLNRLNRMRETLDSLLGQFEIQHWDSVWKMQKEAAQWMPRACLISLDFDLNNSSTQNPGNGMDAVDMLNRRKPVCPIIVHTSLPQQGQTMALALRGGGWTVERVMLTTREALGEWRDAVEYLTGSCES